MGLGPLGVRVFCFFYKGFWGGLACFVFSVFFFWIFRVFRVFSGCGFRGLGFRI